MFVHHWCVLMVLCTMEVPCSETRSIYSLYC